MKYPFLELGSANEPYNDALTQAAARVIASGRYIGGAEVETLERNLCSLTGCSHAVAVSNGLDALRLVLTAWRELGMLREGDEVIIPSNSFIASALAADQAGLKLKFAEPDPQTHNIDWDRIQPSGRTRVIMPVDLYGRMCSVPERFRRDFLILEDACQAIGATGAGAIGHAAAFSFYPTKNVGALGDAGAVTTSDPALAEAVRALRNYGSLRQYENIYRGLNCRMDPIQAAFINVKLPHVDEENALRRSKASVYDREIVNPAVIKPEMPSEPGQHVWHQYVLRIPGGRRDEFRRFMADNGVETAVHYPTPIHLQPCYKSLLSPGLSLPIAETLCSEVVSLPIGRSTSLADAAEISQIINRFN